MHIVRYVLFIAHYYIWISSIQESSNARWWDPASLWGNGAANKKWKRQECAAGTDLSGVKQVFLFFANSIKYCTSSSSFSFFSLCLLSLHWRTMSGFCLAVKTWSCSCPVRRKSWNSSFRNREGWVRDGKKIFPQSAMQYSQSTRKVTCTLSHFSYPTGKFSCQSSNTCKTH